MSKFQYVNIHPRRSYSLLSRSLIFLLLVYIAHFELTEDQVLFFVNSLCQNLVNLFKIIPDL